MNARSHLDNSGLTRDHRQHCPVCGSHEFGVDAVELEGRFVTQVCLVCGLTCQVMVETGSLPLEARVSEWSALFIHD
jgi:transcription elongation factor Elf1